MKKSIFTLISLVFLLGLSQAQQPATIVKILPIEMFVNTIGIGIEQKVFKDYNIQLTGGITQASRFGYYNAKNLKGGFGEIQVRKYGFLEENTIGELYIGMYAGYRYATYTKEATYYLNPIYVKGEYKETGEYLASGFFIGYQLNIAKNKLFLDTYLGAGMRWGRTAQASLDNYGQSTYTDYGSNNGTLTSMNYTGVSPKIGILLGVKL